MPEMQPWVVAFSCCYSTVTFGVALAAFVATLVHWAQLRPHFFSGLKVGALVTVFAVPGSIASFVYFDPSAVGLNQATRLAPELAQSFVWGGLVLGTGLGLVIAFFYPGLQIAVTELAAPGQFPLLLKGDTSFRGWHLSVAVGALAAVATLFLFKLLGIDESETVKQMAKLMPGLREAPAATRLAFGLPAVVGAAISEELLFRGVILSWLTRWFGGGRGAAIGSTILVALVWALAHVANTSVIAPKLVQIFLLGLFFGWVARRHGVEASIAGHVSLNIAAAVGWILME